MAFEIQFDDQSEEVVLPQVVAEGIDALTAKLAEIISFIQDSFCTGQPEKLILKAVNDDIEGLFVDMEASSVRLLLNPDEELLLNDIGERARSGPAFLAFVLSGLKGCLEERTKWKVNDEMTAKYYYDLYFELEDKLKRFQDVPTLQNLFTLAEKSMMVEAFRKSKMPELTIDFNTISSSQARNVANGVPEPMEPILALYLENVIALKDTYALQID